MTKKTCKDGYECSQTSDCLGGVFCPLGGGWAHTARCITHHCVHDFSSGPWVEFEDDSGGSASCACGLTQMHHDLWYSP